MFPVLLWTSSEPGRFLLASKRGQGSQMKFSQMPQEASARRTSSEAPPGSLWALDPGACPSAQPVRLTSLDRFLSSYWTSSASYSIILPCFKSDLDLNPGIWNLYLNPGASKPNFSLERSWGNHHFTSSRWFLVITCFFMEAMISYTLMRNQKGIFLILF